MNTFFKIFTLFCFINVEIVCQTSEVITCNVSIDFPYLVPWIDPNDGFCYLPTDSDISYIFHNVSDFIPNYQLFCSGRAANIYPITDMVSCRCFFEDHTMLMEYDLICDGFVLGAGSSQVDSLRVVVGIAVPVLILVIVLASTIATIFAVILCVVSRKRSVDANMFQPHHMQSIDSGNPFISTSIAQDTEPRLDLEHIYGTINFTDYDYIDEETTHLYFLGTCTDNSEGLYRLIRQTKPLSSSDQLYETVEDQITKVRNLPSSKNVKGTTCYSMVPTQEQRSGQCRDYTKFKSYEYSSYESPYELAFREPSDDVNDLYDQMATEKLLELNRDTITVLEKLGSGEYGEVSRGVWDSPVGDMNVALKEMNKNVAEQSKAAFLQEAAILGQFSHPNVLRLVGVVTLTVPNMIVTELMQEELRRFLLALQTQHNQELDYETIAPHFLAFSRQVASGMQHLAERGCIHRDIAARNILLTDKCVCKIADFGMSRRLEAESDYYRVKGGNKVPVKWSAPEAIFFKRFTLKSDVWSYGMLLYEIWSVGRKPWPYEDNRSAVEKIARGVNLPPPAGCARAVYELMVGTWHPKPDQRPDMKDIVSRLSESDESLLSRGELDNMRGSNAPAFMLGADPIAAEELYKDLQNKYLNIQM